MPIKLIVAHNLAELRKARGLTQGELAAQFSYSDKSISKWEHGDTMPDIEVLKQLCDFYGVTLDYLVTEHEEAQANKKKNQRVANKWTIVALSVLCVWLVAIVIYIAGQIFLDQRDWPAFGWLCFVWGVPASFIVMITFNGIWGKSSWRSILAILLTWSAIAAVYLTVGIFVPNGAGWGLWPIFLVGIPLTIASILWDHVLSKPKDDQ